jgi:hypothetical protein
MNSTDFLTGGSAYGKAVPAGRVRIFRRCFETELTELTELGEGWHGRLESELRWLGNLIDGQRCCCEPEGFWTESERSAERLPRAARRVSRGESIFRIERNWGR